MLAREVTGVPETQGENSEDQKRNVAVESDVLVVSVIVNVVVAWLAEEHQEHHTEHVESCEESTGEAKQWHNGPYFALTRHETPVKSVTQDTVFRNESSKEWNA